MNASVSPVFTPFLDLSLLSPLSDLLALLVLTSSVFRHHNFVVTDVVHLLAKDSQGNGGNPLDYQNILGEDEIIELQTK